MDFRSPIGRAPMRGQDDVAGFIAGFTEVDGYIVDYLVEEVLQRQPDHVRSFLLGTSILDRLSAPLCNAVTGQDSGVGRGNTCLRLGGGSPNQADQ